MIHPETAKNNENIYTFESRIGGTNETTCPVIPVMRATVALFDAPSAIINTKRM